MTSKLSTLTRSCSDCRHARWYDSGNGRDEPRETEQLCNVVDGDARPPGSEVLLADVDGEELNRAMERGDCPAWQEYEPCKEHGLPAHPQAGCDECIRLQNLAEMDADGWVE
jgi:hypothetical protein